LIRQFEFFCNTVKKKCIEKEIYAQNHKLLDTIFFKKLLEVTKMNQMHNRWQIVLLIHYRQCLIHFGQSLIYSEQCLIHFWRCFIYFRL